MRVQFTFKQMDSSRALMDITELKLGHLMKRFKPAPQQAKVTFSMDGRLVRLHASLITSDGHDLEADLAGDNAYSLVDAVVQKLDGQLRKRKERLKNRKYKTNGLQSGVKHNTQFYRSGERYESVVESDSMRSISFWNLPPIDASDILSLSPQRRGPLEPVCAS